MNNITKKLLSVLFVAFFLCSYGVASPKSLIAAQEDEDIQKKPDYWCPKIVFLGRTAEIFKLKKCEYISGITIKIIYNGIHSYPVKIKFTLLDSKGEVMAGNQKKHVFGPQHLEKGQYGIFTIQRYGNDNPSLIEIKGIWEKENGTTVPLNEKSDAKLELIIATSKKDFKLHERIPLLVEFKNMSIRPIVGWWFFEEYNQRVTAGGKYFPEVISEILIRNENNQKIIWKGKWIVKMKSVTVNDFTAILPNKSYKYEIEIQEGANQSGINAVGKYRIQVLYENYSKTWMQKKIKENNFSEKELPYPLSYYWDGSLTSNEIQIVVR